MYFERSGRTRLNGERNTVTAADMQRSHVATSNVQHDGHHRPQQQQQQKQ